MGSGVASFIQPVVINDEGRFVLYLKGKIKCDFSGIETPPIYEMSEIEVPIEEVSGKNPLAGKKIWIHSDNISGIVWNTMDW